MKRKLAEMEAEANRLRELQVAEPLPACWASWQLSSVPVVVLMLNLSAAVFVCACSRHVLSATLQSKGSADMEMVEGGDAAKEEVDARSIFIGQVTLAGRRMARLEYPIVRNRMRAGRPGVPCSIVHAMTGSTSF